MNYKRDDSVRTFINVLRGGPPSPARIAKARSRLGLDGHASALKWVDENPYYRPLVLQGLIAEGPRDFFTREPLLSLSEELECAWYGACLTRYSRRLRTYVLLQSQVQANVLSSDFSAAIAGVEETLYACGHSLWAYELLLALAEYGGGAARRAERLGHLKRQISTGMAHFLINIASLRVDATWTPSVFQTAVGDVTRSYEGEDFADYLTAHTSPRHATTQHSILRSLRWEATASLIDLYEAFVAYYCLRAANERTTVPPTIRRIAERLASSTGDGRLWSALILSGLDTSTSEHFVADPLSLTLNRSMAIGSMPQQIDMALAASSLDAIDLAARLVATTTDPVALLPTNNPVLLRIVTGLASVMAMHKGADSMVALLEKLASDWRPLPFATWLTGVLRREMSADPLESTVASRLAACNASPLDPLRLGDITSRLSKRFSDTLTNVSGRGPWICNGYVDSSDEGRCELEQSLALVAAARRHATALTVAERLSSSSQAYYSSRGLRLKLLILHESGEVIAATRFIVETWLANEATRAFLPIEMVGHAIARSTDQVEQRLVGRPILMDIAAKGAGHPFAAARSVTLEQFLRGWELDRPSQLFVLKDAFSLSQLVYFLRYVCVESVLDATTLFEHSREVIDERLAVVKALLDLDPSAAETYQDEAKDLLKRITVRKRRRQLEQSKIYLELESIRLSAERRVRDHYVRLMTVLETGLDRLIMILRDGSATQSTQLAVFVGIDETLRQIIEAVRNEFVASTDHGLDGYVSLRIRHGTLGNELRAPFEMQRLITTREDVDHYASNLFWRDQFSEQAAIAVDSALQLLSRTVDDIISDLKRDWLQVKKIPGDEGMFDFVISDAVFLRIRSQIDKETKLNELVAIILQELFKLLEESLSAIRRRLRDDAKERAMRALDDLEAFIGAQSDSARGDLRTAINIARTDVQRAFDRVVEWFRVSESAPSEPFTVDEAISIALEVLHLSHSLELMTGGAPETLLRGDRFNAFVDIFIIIFQNIASHSKLDRPSARVHFESDATEMRVRVSNPIASRVNNAENRRKVRTIQDRLVKSTHRAEVAREGGTGFIKLWKIFSHDLRVPDPRITFGFGDTDFFVDAVFPWEACRDARSDRG